ncbi:hypothetical protein BT69DRAFT_1357269 [Atractiella rhizophila]|nr:hypothetical protein BT69DRAFT_1357269 [Atractiella rhizophila]
MATTSLPPNSAPTPILDPAIRSPSARSSFHKAMTEDSHTNGSPILDAMHLLEEVREVYGVESDVYFETTELLGEVKARKISTGSAVLRAFQLFKDDLPFLQKFEVFLPGIEFSLTPSPSSTSPSPTVLVMGESLSLGGATSEEIDRLLAAGKRRTLDEVLGREEEEEDERIRSGVGGLRLRSGSRSGEGEGK